MVIYGTGDPEQDHGTDETCSVSAIATATEAFHCFLRASSVAKKVK